MRPSPKRHPLAVLRSLIGLTQKEMASTLECSVPTIQAVELGKLKLSLSLAERVHFQTGVDSEWLMAADTSKPPVSSNGEIYTKAVFDEMQAALLSPKPTSTAAFFELWKMWSMFIKHTKLLAILYTEAYKRGKVPIAFYKGIMSIKEVMETTIGHDKDIEEKLEKLTYRDFDPVSLFELIGTLEDFEADTYEELKRKLQRTKEPIFRFVRPYMRQYEKNLKKRRKRQ